jgi:hypothetical protein
MALLIAHYILGSQLHQKHIRQVSILLAKISVMFDVITYGAVVIILPMKLSRSWKKPPDRSYNDSEPARRQGFRIINPYTIWSRAVPHLIIIILSSVAATAHARARLGAAPSRGVLHIARRCIGVDPLLKGNGFLILLQGTIQSWSLKICWRERSLASSDVTNLIASSARSLRLVLF